MAQRAEQEGTGETIVNSIERDAPIKDYDVDLVRTVRGTTTRPVTALGGAGKLDDIACNGREFGNVGTTADTPFVFKGAYRAVRINYPARADKNRVVAEARGLAR